MAVKLTRRAPAFRIDDAVLEQLWRALGAKCAEAGPPDGTLTVRETVRAAGRTPEKHENQYRSIDDLRRASNDDRLLRDYTLRVSSPWGDDHRLVSIYASRAGGPASVEVSAPEAAWCHDVMDTVLDLLRPHRTWHAAAHLGGPWAPLWAMGALVAMLVVCSLVLDRPWGPVGFAIYFAGLALLLLRDWLFPAADIRVEPRRPQVAAPGGWPPAGGTDAPAIRLVNDRG